MSSQSGRGKHLQAGVDFHGTGLVLGGVFSGFQLILIQSASKAEGDVDASGWMVAMSFSERRVGTTCQGISSPRC